MGGYGTWDAIARFPNLFAAAAPLSGAGNTDLATSVLASKPIWAYHGAADTTILPSGSTNMYFADKQGGGSPIISYIPNEGHGGWDQYYTPGVYTTGSPAGSGGSGQNVYDWMFSQSLNTTPAGKPPGPAAIEIGFGGGSGNNLAGYTANGTNFIAYNSVTSSTVTNLHDINNASSNITVSIAGQLGSGGGTSKLGAQLAAILPAAVASGGLYTYGDLVGNPNSTIVLTFSGMNDSQKYNLDILGVADTTQNITSYTQYTLTGSTTQSGQTNIINNDNSMVEFDNISSLNGTMTLTVAGVGTSLGYIDSLVLTPVPVPEPTTLGLLTIGGLALLGRRRR